VVVSTAGIQLSATLLEIWPTGITFRRFLPTFLGPLADVLFRSRIWHGRKKDAASCSGPSKTGCVR
jgi:hypothetical protein